MSRQKSDFLDDIDWDSVDDEFLGDVDGEDRPRVDLRFTSDREIVDGIRDRPENSLIYYIGNYPTEEIARKIDVYEKRLKPPNQMWDEVLKTGEHREPGGGWNSTGFEPRYKELLANEDERYEAAKELRARAMVRTIYVGHHGSNKMYSPARVLIQFVRDYVRTQQFAERPTGRVQ